MGETTVAERRWVDNGIQSSFLSHHMRVLAARRHPRTQQRIIACKCTPPSGERAIAEPGLERGERTPGIKRDKA